MMVSYTKARAESIGVRCTVGMMERPERMICLIAGALLDLLEPALWLLAVLSNLTALQRIAFTWRATRDATLLRSAGRRRAAGAGRSRGGIRGARDRLAAPKDVGGGHRGLPARRRRPADSRVQHRRGQGRVIGDHVRYLLAEALSRGDDLAAARAAALASSTAIEEPSGAARAAARGDARPARGSGCRRADRAGATDQRVSRLARAARRTLSARADRRGARPARRRGADLPGRAAPHARERLRRRRERSHRRAAGRGCSPAPVDGDPAGRAGRAIAPRQRARCGHERGPVHRRRDQGERRRNARCA